VSIDESASLFYQEEELLSKTKAIVELSEHKDNPLLKDLQEITNGYNSLLRQSKKLVKMSDSSQKKLNETIRKLEETTKLLKEEQARAEELLLNILPLKIAEELKSNGFVSPVYYESVSILFTDFKNFTSTARYLKPQQLVKKLDLAYQEFDEVCMSHSVEKLKTIGDAYMCVAGLPNRNKTHPIDICLVAIKFQKVVVSIKDILSREFNEDFWDIRIGIHSGSVISGVIGKSKFSFDIWGDAVNVAARLESGCIENRINVSHTTYESAKDFFDFEYRGKFEAKNRGSMDMYFLNGIKPELAEREIRPNQTFLKMYEEFKNY
jgi:adenylate cyclase